MKPARLCRDESHVGGSTTARVSNRSSHKAVDGWETEPVTHTQQPSARGWVLGFLAALVAALAATLAATSATASAAAGAETRVGAISHGGEVLVGSLKHETPGQRLGEAAPQRQTVVATGVAVEGGSSIAGDLAAAESHLATIPDALEFGPNKAMLESIRSAIDTGRSLTAAERTFLDHELLEAQLVRSGLSLEAAHAEVLNVYPPGSNFSPEVIKEFSDHFSNAYFQFWGITR